jgi:hypothetical protein
LRSIEGSSVTFRLPPEELLKVIRISQAERRAEAHPRTEPDPRHVPIHTGHVPFVAPLRNPVREQARWSPMARS